MQIYAFDSQNVAISAGKARRQTIYQCPECKKSVRLRGGRFRRAHFYHLAASDCRLYGKSLIHLHIQYCLQKMLAPENVILECRFPQIDRIADVCLPDRRLIFEVQVSAISAQEVEARNRDYSRLGYQVIWILHDRRFNQFRVSAAEITLRHFPHYFTNINAFGKVFFYDQHASFSAKRRIKRTPRFPVHFKNISYLKSKQFLSHLPQDRKKWTLSVAGDLCHRPLIWKEPNRQRCPLFVRLYTILLHLLLEKTTRE